MQGRGTSPLGAWEGLGCPRDRVLTPQETEQSRTLLLCFLLSKILPQRTPRNTATPQRSEHQPLHLTIAVDDADFRMCTAGGVNSGFRLELEYRYLIDFSENIMSLSIIFVNTGKKNAELHSGEKDCESLEEMMEICISFPKTTGNKCLWIPLPGGYYNLQANASYRFQWFVCR